MWVFTTFEDLSGSNYGRQWDFSYSSETYFIPFFRGVSQSWMISASGKLLCISLYLVLMWSIEIALSWVCSFDTLKAYLLLPWQLDCEISLKKTLKNPIFWHGRIGMGPVWTYRYILHILNYFHAENTFVLLNAYLFKKKCRPCTLQKITNF